ncbi:hypothetical protein O9993_23345 [Vibrio lentus]|nr:hypothetical protein [Vibrio lentus]
MVRLTCTITVTGTNDAPALAAQTQSVTEGGNYFKADAGAAITDYNAQTFLSFAIANPVDKLNFLIAMSSYSFDPSNTTYQHLVGSPESNPYLPVTVTDSAKTADIQNLA